MAYEEKHSSILLISDNQVDIRRIERQFMDTGALECKLYRCSTIGAAVEQLGNKRLQIDLVILDLRLENAGSPDDLYKELQAASGDVPVIVLGGDSVEELAETDLVVLSGAGGQTSRDHFDELVGLIRKLVLRDGI